jgi:glutaredoxin
MLALAAFFAFNPAAKANAQGIETGQADKITAYFFHSLTCPHCQAEKRFLDRLAEKYSYLEVKAYELSESESQRVYLEESRRLNFPANYLVPMTVIGDKYISGF